MAEEKKKSWPERAEKFARDRARILKILNESENALDMAQLMGRFKMTYRYLPHIERRMYELLKDELIVKIPGPIPRYKPPHKIPRRRR